MDLIEWIGMSITADQEREFYDRIYSKYLNLSDDDLVCNRRVIAANLANPDHPIYERRRMYETVLSILVSQPVTGCSVLDYGCGTGDWGLMLATEGAHVTFLDLSPAAIRLVLRRAMVSGAGSRVRAIAGDASDLRCFGDGEFDLIYASAAIHHTLKYANALPELVRVLRAGGKVVIAETYGNNKLLNLARRSRWALCREPAEAGEEILFNDGHIAALSAQLECLQLTPLNLLAMTKRIFRGRFRSKIVRRFVTCLEALDSVALRWAPFLKRYCGEVVVVAQKPKTPAGDGYR